MVLACGEADDSPGSPTIDGQPIDASVVTHLAARDGIDDTAARVRVIETLRLAAAARDPQTTADATLLDARREHLLRTARARLVLHTDFEANHGPEDIPAGDPLLARARVDPRIVHPRLHHVCQIIAEPAGQLQGDELAQRSAEPVWLARATARMQDVRRHLEATLPIDDAQACDLLLRDVPLETVADDADIVVRAEAAGGFDLEACAIALAADGTCTQPQFAPEWVDAVRPGPVPGLRGPFATRFGVHVALVREVLPASAPDDDEFETRVRAAVHPMWRAAALGEWVSMLRTRHTALAAIGAE